MTTNDDSTLEFDLVPSRYRGLPHPIIEDPDGCTACPLGKLTNNCAIGGAGSDDLTKVKLICISDHSGFYERSHGYPMYDNDQDRKQRASKRKGNKILDWRNAGGTVRLVLKEQFGLHTWEEVWFTNALKCDRLSSTIKLEHISACTQKWLGSEFETLDRYAPEAPILVLGNYAYRALKRMDPTLKVELPTSLQKVRRTSTYRWRHHPLIFSFNPASVATSIPRLETLTTLTADNKQKVLGVEFWEPCLPGSPYWVFLRDLDLLRPFL